MITMRAVRQGLLPGLIVAGVLAASLLVRPLGLNSFPTSVGCSYGYLGAPTVTGIAPTSGSLLGGTSVVITGCGFTGATAVHFGATAAAGFVVNTDSQVTATSPAHAAGAVDVDVTTPAGTSAHTSADMFTFGTQVCTGVTATANNSGPVTSDFAGSIINIVGVATGCTHPLFQFFVLNPGGSWVITQAFSARNNFNWDTRGPEPAGTYNYAVWVHDATQAGAHTNSLGSYDAFTGAAFPLNTKACTSVTIGFVQTSPQAQGTAITVTGNAVGCTGNGPEYEFLLLAPGSSTWFVAQAYSFSNSFSWQTFSQNGTYHVGVWAKDFSSPGLIVTSFGTLDVFAGSTFTLT
jgi:hypothetical protein